MPAKLLVQTLRDPACVLPLDVHQWTALLTCARAESLLGSVAAGFAKLPVPDDVRAVLNDALSLYNAGRLAALWEADCARRALADYPGSIVLMKGTAYLAAGLAAGQGRSVGDLDIMVAREDLPQVEALLLAAGWEWVKPDPYDDAYYRTHMHELPPLIHVTRDKMIDVHHTILPLTARPRPDAAAMMADAVRLESGLYVFAPADMLCHSIAHMLADGDLAGGLRNLWDIDRMLREFCEGDGFWPELAARARRHGLQDTVARALRLAQVLYDTPVDTALAGRPRWSDRLFLAQLTARNGWGQETRKLLRLAFYIRSHWLRMPPLMLAKHLWVKWRKRPAA